MAGRAYKESAQRISGCVTALLREQPFFGSLALRLPVRADASRETVASDGHEIRYAPRWVAETDAHLIETAIARVVLACALKHHTRRGERDPERWQHASQLVTHGLLRDAGFTLPPDAEAWDGISVEQAYDRLPDPDGDGDGQDQSSPSAGGGAGAFASAPDPQSGGDDDDDSGDSGEPSVSPGDGDGEADGQDGQSDAGASDAPASCDPSGTGEVMDAPAGDEGGDANSGPSADIAEQEQAWDEAMHQALSLAKAEGRAPGGVPGSRIAAIRRPGPHPVMAVEDLRGAGGRQDDAAVFGRDLDPHPLDPRGRHLAGERAAPDQPVERRGGAVRSPASAGAGFQVFRPAREIGRANRLVRFLQVAPAGAEDPRLRRQPGTAERAADLRPRLRDRGRRHRRRIGAHVGDEPRRPAAELDPLVEPLRRRHRLGDGEAEPARRLLLQGRGCEGRRRRSALRVPRDLRHREPRHADAPGRGLRQGRRREAARRGTVRPGTGPGLSVPTAVPSRRWSAAGKAAPSAGRISAPTVQYRRATKASIAASRSQTRRSATDCTRPAERQPGSLRQSTGDRP